MYAAVSFARHFAADRLDAPFLMALLIGIGAASYAGLAWIANRAAVHDIAELLGVERFRGKHGGSNV
jgi:methyl coenzyme M reductase alpha subunit